MWGVCVCVEHLFAKVTCTCTLAGGQRPSSKRFLTKLCLKVDAQSDQLCVPAKQNGRRGHLIVQLVANFCGRFYMSGRHSHVHTCQCSFVAETCQCSSVAETCPTFSVQIFAAIHVARGKPWAEPKSSYNPTPLCWHD